MGERGPDAGAGGADAFAGCGWSSSLSGARLWGEWWRAAGCARPRRNPDLDQQVVGCCVRELPGCACWWGVVVTEVGSVLDGCRRTLNRVLSEAIVTVLVVEDRLARWGVGHLDAVLSASGRRVVVLDPQETTSGLAREVTEVRASMCAGLDGKRAARDRAARGVAVATEVAW
jgi:putative resolvase